MFSGFIFIDFKRAIHRLVFPFASFVATAVGCVLGQMLMVNEPAGICRSGRPGYWLPAGRVDDGEGFVEAAVREAEEEAGVAVEVTGLLRCGLSGGTPRIVLYARPRGGGSGEGGVPKSIPDFESVGAMWVDHELLAALGLSIVYTLQYSELASCCMSTHSRPYRANAVMHSIWQRSSVRFSAPKSLTMGLLAVSLLAQSPLVVVLVKLAALSMQLR